MESSQNEAPDRLPGMKCKHWKKLGLDRFVREEADPHVAQCPDCSRELAATQRVIELLQLPFPEEPGTRTMDQVWIRINAEK